jgi:hypothetical protein
MEKRKKKPKDEVISGDEVVGGEKKKRKTTKKSKKKKEDVETESDAVSGVETGEEEGEDMIEKRKRETLALLKARSKVCSVLFSTSFPLSSLSLLSSRSRCTCRIEC